MTKEELTWRSFVDLGQAGAGPIAKQWNLAATPSFYLLDHKGIIRHKWTGPPGRRGARSGRWAKWIREAEGAASRPGSDEVIGLLSPGDGRALDAARCEVTDLF